MAKRALGHAFEAVAAIQRRGVEVRWVRRPFILRPERRGVMPWLDVLTDLSFQRVGSRAWVDGFVKSMTQNGRAVGINFDFGGDVGNSLDSLRAVAWAATQDPDGALQNRLCDVLARNHFERKQCVAVHGNIIAAAGEVGLDTAGCKAVLDEPSAFADQVKQQLANAARSGIHSIPEVAFYWIDDARRIDGGCTAAALAAHTARVEPEVSIGGARSAEEYRRLVEQHVLPAAVAAC